MQAVQGLFGIHYTKMLKANCVDHSIYGAQAGLYIQLYYTELWPLIKLLGFHTDEVSTTKLIVHLTQPAVAVARVWKSPVAPCMQIDPLISPYCTAC